MNFPIIKGIVATLQNKKNHGNARYDNSYMGLCYVNQPLLGWLYKATEKSLRRGEKWFGAHKSLKIY